MVNITTIVLPVPFTPLLGLATVACIMGMYGDVIRVPYPYHRGFRALIDGYGVRSFDNHMTPHMPSFNVQDSNQGLATVSFNVFSICHSLSLYLTSFFNLLQLLRTFHNCNTPEVEHQFILRVCSKAFPAGAHGMSASHVHGHAVLCGCDSGGDRGCGTARCVGARVAESATLQSLSLNFAFQGEEFAWHLHTAVLPALSLLGILREK
ncbi:hypothetical protein EV702DRAFT_1049816 [Suillus placidus]|uniref:Uncharacterized protein n=1 Tax=Suillus placidus TaxID=48579 RepID=A0A9P7CXS0_9AGAM|nr:hypothetical protein EV702DRAFT_1049816 [Suillus placidus]